MDVDGGEEELSPDEEEAMINEEMYNGLHAFIEGISQEKWTKIISSQSQLLKRKDLKGRVATLESAVFEPPLNETPQELAEIRRLDDEYIRDNPGTPEDSRYEYLTYNTRYAVLMGLRQKRDYASRTEGVKENRDLVRDMYKQRGVKMDDENFVAPNEDEERDSDAEAEEDDNVASSDESGDESSQSGAAAPSAAMRKALGGKTAGKGKAKAA